VQGVLGFTRQHVVDRYLDPSNRTAALTTMGDTCRAILDRADHVTLSGLRLAAVRGVIEAAVSLDHIEDLRACLADDTVPGGPVLDADLRWRILLRLSVLGAVGSDELEDELARDTSGAGPEGAARCRAALPSRATKDAAWEAMFGGGQEAEALSTYWFRQPRRASGNPSSGPCSLRLSTATSPRPWLSRRDGAPRWQRQSEPLASHTTSSTRPRFEQENSAWPTGLQLPH